MRKDVQYYFDLAMKVADAKDDKRSFKVASIGVRKDGVIVASANGPTPYPLGPAHSEARVARKLDYFATVYVVRILRRDGSLALARPCPNCQRVLLSRRVERVYYSISPNEMGMWLPYKNTDQYYQFDQ